MELDVLHEVHLDPKNVRLEVADARVEADIIEDLFANEGALGLVETICTVGYLTHETPIVLERDHKYVMVEGNRRLAALKAIQNPMLVPEYQSRVSAFAAQLPDRSALSRIEVLAAPSQDQADQLIAAIHTGHLRKPWTPARQAAFFQVQIDSGRGYRELLERYPTIDVKNFVFRAHIVNRFRKADYGSAELQDFMKSKQWSRGLSTLARIFESKPFLELTGLSMDENGVLSMSISDQEFEGIAHEIVKGMEAGNINTRTLNSVKSPRFLQLMAALREVVGNHNGWSAGEAPFNKSKSSGSERAGDTDVDQPSSTDTETVHSPGGQDSPAAKSSGSSSSARRSSSRTRHLDLSQMKAPDHYPEALKLLLAEMSDIDVRRYPNATFLMIRAALEKSIKSFAEAKNIDIKATGNNSQGYVQLKHALNWLDAYVKDHGPRFLVQPIQAVKSGNLTTYTNTGDSLNAQNHNHHFSVNSDQVLEMWSSIHSIMKFVLTP
jgi:hypothetical protein